MKATRAQTTKPETSRTAAKERVVRWLLVAVAVWPAVHHGLVLSYGLNKWHFFGMAMYCTPRPPLSVDLVDARGQPIPLERMPPSVREAIQEFGERRRAWGRLLPPDGLAHEVFDQVPWLQHVEIVVTSFEFRAEAAHFERDVARFVYDRR